MSMVSARIASVWAGPPPEEVEDVYPGVLADEVQDP
jgi:hypothetical protein